MEHVIRSFARLIEFIISDESSGDRFRPDRRTHLLMRGGKF
jgi:hypothetical protein